jgi:transposase
MPYDYFEYLLTEIPKHLDDKNDDFCKNLLYWSESLPAKCRKKLQITAAQNEP